MTDWSGIAVIAPAWTPVAARLVSRGREMANSLGCYLRVVTEAAHVAEAGAAGADEVLTSDDICAGKLDPWIRSATPEALLLEDTPHCARIAGRLAGIFVAPILAGVVSVDFDLNERLLLMRIETFGGRQLEEWAAIPEAKPVFALVKAERLPEPMPGYGREPEVRPLS
ncbi:MAG: hypothetical protein AAB074_04805 [Planctomycetota bacterium]